MNLDSVVLLRTAAPLGIIIGDIGRCKFDAGKRVLSTARTKCLCWEFDIVESILLEGGDVKITGCTIIYHGIKKNVKCCKMDEASRRHGYSEVIDQ